MTQYSGKIIRKNPVTPTQQSASGVWTTADAAAAVKNNNWPVAGVPNPISRSVRLRNSASAYLNRTPSSASDRRTWTWSGWVKRGLLTTRMSLMGGYTGTTNGTLRTDITILDGAALNVSSDQMQTATDFVLQTTQLFRDPSAWYHIVVAMDTTQATSTNRVKIYVNGVQVTAFSTATYPSLNYQGGINFTNNQYINRWFDSSAGSYYGDGYMTEVNFIDGQALTPSSFGTTDSITGAWVPMPYTGTYGTNGFYLNFKDNTSTTTIGYDYSGNSNNWTANNISLTAGVTYDSMVDVPTLWMPYNTAGDVGATVRGNYCTLNPLQAGVAPSDGNLKITGATAHRNVLSTQYLPASGLFYFEGFAPAIQRISFGLATSAFSLTTDAGSSSVFIGCYGDSSLLRVWDRGTNIFSLSSVAANDVFQIAIDCTTGKAWFGRNNTWYNSTGATTGNPSAGTNQTFTITNPTDYAAELGVYDASSNSYINFGQRPFTYTPPTGFKTLNTFNLPAPTISNGATVMAATLYTGNATARTIDNSVNGVSFQPDLVWIKSRSSTTNNQLVDAVRGTSLGLSSNLTSAEYGVGVNAFASNGFGLTTDGSLLGVNVNAATYVAWQWNAGGSTVTNTSGSISSQVRASTTAGFSVVTFTSTLSGSGSATIGHGLGVAPSMIIVKIRNGVNSWGVYHKSIGNTALVYLELTSASNTAIFHWNNTSPTSTVFTVGYGGATGSAGDRVAYCFAEVAGYSKFGSYTGNGSTDGPFVYTGFRPRWVMIKSSTTAFAWIVYDTSRSTYNSTNLVLQPNVSTAEVTAADIDVLSNGFKLRTTDGAVNGSTQTFIYAAFAENPFKYSNAR